MDLKSILNIADMRLASNGLSDVLKACLSTRRHKCRAWKQGYQKCFGGKDISRGASLAGITADGTVNDYIMPSHILKITHISQKL